jgi:hypothetical protein
MARAVKEEACVFNHKSKNDVIAGWRRPGEPA